jgi:hypothetical protein
MSNTLVAVETYNVSGLEPLKNSKAFIYNSNMRFKDFNTTTLNHDSRSYGAGIGINSNQLANRGPSFTYDLPPRAVAVQNFGSLNATAIANSLVQYKRTVTVNRSAITNYSWSDNEFVLNLTDYMPKFITPAINGIGSIVEKDVATTALTNTYRLYGDGTTAINSFQQIATAAAKYRNFGSTGNRLHLYLPSVIVPSIIEQGLGQFVINRNEDISKDWFFGSFAGIDIFTSDVLPVSNVPALTAGATLTLVSSTYVSFDQSTLTFNVTGSGSYDNVTNFLQPGQIIKFGDNVGVGNGNVLRFLTFQDYTQSASAVTCNVTANASTNGSAQITVTVSPGLLFDTGTPAVNQDANLNQPLVANMVASVVPSHVCAVMTDPDAIMLATPRLNNLSPFHSSSITDPDTGLSLRTYYGSVFQQGSTSLVNDVLYGFDGTPQYMMRLAIPFSQINSSVM